MEQEQSRQEEAVTQPEQPIQQTEPEAPQQEAIDFQPQTNLTAPQTPEAIKSTMRPEPTSDVQQGTSEDSEFAEHNQEKSGQRRNCRAI